VEQAFLQVRRQLRQRPSGRESIQFQYRAATELRTSHLQRLARHLQRLAARQVVRPHRPRTMRSRIQSLGPSEGHRPQNRARSIATDAVSPDQRWALIAALHLVFVSLLRSLVRSTGRRFCGGPATMTMYPVNMGVGVRGTADTGRAAGKTKARSRMVEAV